MKHLLLVLFLSILVSISNAQIYKINAYNGQTVSTCKGQFTSSGFVDANNNAYGNSQNYTVTFCSAGGTKLKINFFYIELEAGYDRLYIYDGPSAVPAALIATLTGNQMYKDYTSSGTCLTFRFVSDGANAIGRGWLGFLGCPPVACGANPPASDACSSATPICDLNGYCGATSGWYTADNYNIDAAHSGIFCGTIQNNSWLSFIAGATTASFNITSSNCSDPSQGIQAHIYSTSNCTSFTSKSTCEDDGQGTFPISATGLTVGQKYYIMIDGCFGNDCDYTIQATSGIQTVSVAPVGATNTACSGQSLTLKATVTGGTGTPTYTWAPAPVSGQGTNTATYAASAITYSCTVTGICGGVTATYTPTINTSPTVSVVVAGSNTICTGGVGTTLTASSTLGNPTLNFKNENDYNIPDNSTSGATSTIVVSGISGTVASQLTSVCLNITHGYDEDLDISLKCPNGTTIDLSSDNGGSGNNYTNTCFSTSGTAITAGSAPFSGTYTPEQPLSNLSGCTANGTWSLIVKDDMSPDAGTLTSWSLTFLNGVTYAWSPATGLSSTTGAVVTANPTTTTTYTVTATDKVGCSGSTTSTINVTTTPAVPGVTSPVKYCTGATASPLSATGTNLLWYTSSSGGTGSSTAPTPSTTTAGVTNYYVSQKDGTCESARSLIAVEVSTTPSAPTVTSPVTYCQYASTSALTATGTNLLWYTAASGGVGSSSAPIPSSATAGTTNHYVSQTVGTCESGRALIQVVINPTPAAPTVTSPVTYCQGAVASQLTATGTNLLWYTVASGGTGSATAPTPQTTVANTTYYYVSATTGTCEGARSTIQVIVNPKSNASFTYAGSTFCITGANPSPTITGIAGGTFTAPAGLTINASSGLITLATSTLNTYVVTYQVGGTCPNSATFEVTITNSPNANFTYSSAAFCQYTSNPDPMFAVGASAGTFSATPVGLVFVNSNTGVIDLTASTPGITYTITNTIAAAGGCSPSTSTPFNVTINPSPTITNSNSAVVCSGVALNVALTSVVPTATYTWVADPNNNTTGESTAIQTGPTVNDVLMNTTNTPQVVIYTVTAKTTANCMNIAPHKINVTVNPAPQLTNSKTAIVCSGTPLTIPLISSVNAMHTWIAVNNANTTGESITTQITDTIKDNIINNNTVPEKVIYTIVSQSVSGNCFNILPDSITVTVNPVFTLSNTLTSTVCSGVPLAIPLMSNGSATYTWIAVDNVNTTGESLTLQTSDTLNNNLINTTSINQVVNYGVTVVSPGNCAAPAKTIAVTVYPKPVLSNADTLTVCSGTPLNIVLASAVKSTFSWSAGDNLITLGETTTLQTTGIINDIIFNKSTSPQNITYTINLIADTGACTSLPHTIVVTINPEPVLLNADVAEVCSGVPLDITLYPTLTAVCDWKAIDNLNTTGESITSQISNVINDNIINNVNIPTIVVYNIKLTSPANCVNTSDQLIKVTVNPAPAMTNATTGLTCSGVPLNIPLTSNIGAVFSWIADNNLNITGESIVPNGSTVIKDSLLNSATTPEIVNYTITLTSTIGSCLNITPGKIAVTVNPAPFLTNADTAVVCSGVPLNIILASNISTSYNWVAGDNANTTGESTTAQTTGIINDIIINNTDTAQTLIYTIDLMAGNCKNISPEKIIIIVNPEPKLNTPNKATICSGVPLNIALTSSVNATYSWLADMDYTTTTGETHTVPSAANIITDTLINLTTIPQTVMYTINLTSVSGNCKNINPQTIAVIVNPDPKLTNATTAVICSGEPLNVLLTSSVSAAYSWVATDNANTNGESHTTSVNTAIINDVIINTSTTPQVVTYTITLTSLVGNCKNNTPQVITITVNPKPIADTTALAIKTSDCGSKSGAITGIAMASGITPLKYAWQNMLGTTVDTTLNLTNVGPGTYILTITDANGCYAKVGAGKTLNVTSVKKVKAAFTPTPSTGEIPLTVSFTNNSIGAVNYNWSFNTGVSTLKDPTHVYNQVGKFQACLIADDGGTCFDTVCTTIDAYINSVFIIPNVFTPNSDGNNDVFTIMGKGIESIHAQIFNRWGQKEYEWNTTNGGWDGRSATGLPATSGTYYFMIRAKGLDGKTYSEKGSLTLLR